MSAGNSSWRAKTEDREGPQVARRAAGDLVGHHQGGDGSKEDAVTKVSRREEETRQPSGAEDREPIRRGGPQAGPRPEKRRFRQGRGQPRRRGDEPLDGAGGDLLLEADPLGRGAEQKRSAAGDDVDVPGFEDNLDRKRRRERLGQFDLHDLSADRLDRNNALLVESRPGAGRVDDFGRGEDPPVRLDAGAPPPARHDAEGRGLSQEGDASSPGGDEKRFGQEPVVDDAVFLEEEPVGDFRRDGAARARGDRPGPDPLEGKTGRFLPREILERLVLAGKRAAQDPAAAIAGVGAGLFGEAGGPGRVESAALQREIQQRSWREVLRLRSEQSGGRRRGFLAGFPS